MKANALVIALDKALVISRKLKEKLQILVEVKEVQDRLEDKINIVRNNYNQAKQEIESVRQLLNTRKQNLINK